MSDDERIERIKFTWKNDPASADIGWLISQVKRLTLALDHYDDKTARELGIPYKASELGIEEGIKNLQDAIRLDEIERKKTAFYEDSGGLSFIDVEWLIAKIKEPRRINERRDLCEQCCASDCSCSCHVTGDNYIGPLHNRPNNQSGGSK
jgi:hypothetical protein